MKKITIALILSLPTLIFIIFFKNYCIVKFTKIKNYSNTDKGFFIIIRKNKFERGDLVLWQLNATKIMSRLIAKNKDIVLIKSDTVYVNNKFFENSVRTIKVRIFVQNETQKNFLEKNFEIIHKNPIINTYIISMPEKYLPKLSHFKNFKIISAEPNFRNNKLFPYSFRYQWNESNFGPIQIPSNETIIKLSPEKYSLWHFTLKNFENVNLNKNHLLKEFKFKHNYVFILNDKSHETKDSREFGPIPETLIIGRVVLIL